MRRGIIFLINSSALFAMVILFWYVGSKSGWFNSFLLPSPHSVLQSVSELFWSGELARHVWSSLKRIIEGFLISSVLGLTLGLLCAVRPGLLQFTGPFLEFLRHIPPIALIPLFILWIGLGEGSKIAIIVLSSFFPVFINTYDGIESIPRGLFEVGRSFHLSTWSRIRWIAFPGALFQVLTGMRLGLGYSWRALVGAEMLAASSGLGFMILEAEQMARADVILAGVIITGVLGSLMDALLKRTVTMLTPWHGA